MASETRSLPPDGECTATLLVSEQQQPHLQAAYLGRSAACMDTNELSLRRTLSSRCGS